MKRSISSIVLILFFLPSVLLNPTMMQRRRLTYSFILYPGTDIRSSSGLPGPSTGKIVKDLQDQHHPDTAKHARARCRDHFTINNSPDNLKFSGCSRSEYHRDGPRGLRWLACSETGGRWANAILLQMGSKSPM